MYQTRTFGRHWPALVASATLLVCLSLSATAQETSVRPGINDTFKESDVSQFVERFEREGREVYDQRTRIMEACELKPGMTVADVGAGTGLFTRLLSKSVGETGQVFAVDITEKFVEHIQAMAKKEGLENVEGVVCQPDFVNLPPASVDLVFICDTYHHFEFPFKTMASIRRALKPGGRVVLVEFSRIEGESSDFILEHVRAGQDVFAEEITRSGFRQTKEVKGFFETSYLLHFEPSTGSDSSDK